MVCSSQAMVLLDSKEIEEKLEQQLDEHSKDDEKELSVEEAPQEESIEGEEDKKETPNRQKSRWQIGTHRASLEEERQTQLEDIVEEETSEPHLRRSKRTRKQNPKYANAVLVEGPSITEPSTYEEARQKKDW